MYVFWGLQILSNLSLFTSILLQRVVLLLFSLVWLPSLQLFPQPPTNFKTKLISSSLETREFPQGAFYASCVAAQINSTLLLRLLIFAIVIFIVPSSLPLFHLPPISLSLSARISKYQHPFLRLFNALKFHWLFDFPHQVTTHLPSYTLSSSKLSTSDKLPLQTLLTRRIPTWYCLRISPGSLTLA